MQDQPEKNTPTLESENPAVEAPRTDEESPEAPTIQSSAPEIEAVVPDQMGEATAEETEQTPAAEEKVAELVKEEEVKAEPVAATAQASQDASEETETPQHSEPTTEARDTEPAPPAQKSPQASSEPAKAAPAEEPARLRLGDLKPGMMLDGTVTRTEKYGAFVNLGLADRRDGLIHISELAPNRVRRVEDVVKGGDQVRVRVVSVDRSKGRIALSLNEAPEETASLDEVNRRNEKPDMTSMAAAFERARVEKREQQQAEQATAEDRGARRKREQEELMRRLSGE